MSEGLTNRYSMEGSDEAWDDRVVFEEMDVCADVGAGLGVLEGDDGGCGALLLGGTDENRRLVSVDRGS